MKRNGFANFFLSIVLPSILAITLFIISIYIIIIPSFEKNMMERKKEMINELTNTVVSLIREYNADYENGLYTLEEAHNNASSRIEKIRYGSDRKDYFWITDMHPNMVMHPYRKELDGTDLTNYQDPSGKKLFVEAVILVREKGEGYINYQWQWKDDTTRIVPKLSYVTGFGEWGWIVGTGIYLEDVKEEIAHLKNRLLRVSFIITLVIIISLLYIIRQSLKIERSRSQAENKLLLSRQKYKSLVEASTDGTLMIINNKIIFANLRFRSMSGYETEDLDKLSFDELFDVPWKELLTKFEEPDKSVSLETNISGKNNIQLDVVISISKIKYANEKGYIVITKEISPQKQFELGALQLSQELQTSLLIMNQSIKFLIKDLIKCSIDTSIYDAVQLMVRKKQDVIFIENKNTIIGVVNDSDLKNRVISKKLDLSTGISGIMSSPVRNITDNALLYEAMLQFQKENISHLIVKDNSDNYIGSLSCEDVFKTYRNTVSYLVKEIEVSENIQELIKIHHKIPVIVEALLESSDKAQNITRVITTLSDAITIQVIKLAIEETGTPPCRFAFIAMGSEGRMEQTLSTDQDNAIVFEDADNELLEQSYTYFRKLAKIINDNLNTIGYRLCKGDIMAQNPRWTQPLSVWKNYYAEWIAESDPQSILDASIMFDFRSLFGEHGFAAELRKYVNELTENKAVFFQHLALPVIKFKSPVGIFGQIVGSTNTDDSNMIDIKKILRPIISFIRIYALKYNLSETNSLNRIEQLNDKGLLNKSLYNELVLSYNYLMLMRFRFQTISILKKNQADNMVDISKLTDIEKTTLKKILSEITNLQTKLSFDFKGTM